MPIEGERRIGKTRHDRHTNGFLVEVEYVLQPEIWRENHWWPTYNSLAHAFGSGIRIKWIAGLGVTITQTNPNGHIDKEVLKELQLILPQMYGEGR